VPLAGLDGEPRAPKPTMILGPSEHRYATDHNVRYGRQCLLRSCLASLFPRSTQFLDTKQLTFVTRKVSSLKEIKLWQLLLWWRGPAVEHWSLADVLLLSCARLVADG